MSQTPMVRVPRTGHSFSQVPSVSIPRSQFDRSCGRKMTFNADDLTPCFVDEVLPGDTFTMKAKGFARVFSPLKAPIMDNIYLDLFFFFVPYRLVWDNWEKFNGAQDDPGDSTDFTIPIWSNGAVSEGNLMDHLGLPPGLDGSDTNINALPIRAYRLIFDEWFRDQNLVDSTMTSAGATGDGPDTWGQALYKRAKKHDYFTSALPWPQKSTDPVTIPLGTSARVATVPNTGPVSVWSVGAASLQRLDSSGAELAVDATAGSPTNQLYADLSEATAASINQLREAFQIQRLLERDARGGTRYIELIKSHFGVTNPDFRLQRPEYLGGGSGYINVTPIAQTSETDPAGTAQGTLTATATAGLNGSFAKSFTEHGVVLGLINARADLTYQQGLSRMWSRQTRYEFYWPSLAQIGEQTILNKEIFYTGTPATDDAAFGYQERYAEYRYKPSELTGKFRSDATGSLDLWHLAEDFASVPALNSTFIQSNTPMARIQAVTSEPDFIADLWFDLKCARPMPLFGVPGLIDHF